MKFWTKSLDFLDFRALLLGKVETCERQFSVTAPSLPAAWQLPEVDSIGPRRAKTGNETQFYLTCKLPSCWGRRKEYTQRYLEIGGDQEDLITACNVNPRLNSETGKGH